jgi:hypothetical protein
MRRPITGIGRTEVTTTNNWLTKARYDRFFTANNSGYAAGQAAADRIAGKSFAGGGQVGYSRQLYKNDRPPCVSELGYDYSYETLRRAARPHADPSASFARLSSREREVTPPAARPPASRPCST